MAKHPQQVETKVEEVKRDSRGKDYASDVDEDVTAFSPPRSDCIGVMFSSPVIASKGPPPSQPKLTLGGASVGKKNVSLDAEVTNVSF